MRQRSCLSLPRHLSGLGPPAPDRSSGLRMYTPLPRRGTTPRVVADFSSPRAVVAPVCRGPADVSPGCLGSGLSVPPRTPLGYRVRLPPVRRASFLQLGLLAIVAAAITTAVAVGVPWLPVEASREAERIDVHLLVRDRDLAVRVRGRRGDPHLLADQLPRQGPERLVGRPADPRAHGARGGLDGHPDILVTAIASSARSCSRRTATPGSAPAQGQGVAQQFAWGSPTRTARHYPILRLPIDRQVELSCSERRDPLASGCRSSPRSRMPCPARTRAS